MMTELLYCCKLKDESGNFEAVAEFLNAAELEFSSFEDKETGTVFHTVYALTQEEGAKNEALLRQSYPMWNEYGTRISDLEVFEMKKEDWAEVWKKYFHIIPISERLIVKPSWLELSPSPNQVVVEIDPGMSFGTGQHATTAYCLKIIDRLAGKENVKSLLDAGCGSGILSIAAAKLGFSPVAAFDYDPDAVMVAGENFEFNQLAKDAIELFQADAENYQSPRQYDLVVANILGHLLKKYKNNITTWVRPQGYLTLAGILNEEFDDLSKEFTAIGYTELDRFSEREWTSGLFVKNKA